DDGSTDNTEHIVRAMADPRIRYYKLPHSGHTAVLKNFCIQQSTGNYIAFIDSDDLWTDHKLEKQIQLFSQHPGIGFSVTDATTFKNETVLSARTYPRAAGIECGSIFNRMKENRFVVYNPT